MHKSWHNTSKISLRMPKSVNCCVPGCTNNFRNNPGIKYYRIPKDEKVRRRYEILIRNATLKVKLDNTRICEQHLEGGIKKSRYDLPSIFPWSKPASTRRVLKWYCDENHIFPIEPILKHKQVACMTRKMLFTIFKYLFSFQRYLSF